MAAKRVGSIDDPLPRRCVAFGDRLPHLTGAPEAGFLPSGLFSLISLTSSKSLRGESAGVDGQSLPLGLEVLALDDASSKGGAGVPSMRHGRNGATRRTRGRESWGSVRG